MRVASHNVRLSLSLASRAAGARESRGRPAQTSRRGASALAYVATDASRRARASASRTRPSADSVSPTGNIHKSAANKARTSKIGCTASKDQTTPMSADELREKTGPYGAWQRI